MNQETLQRAARWISKQMSAAKSVSTDHPSFAAQRILVEADKKFALGSYGVEGWSDVTGRSGVQYLNYGGPYEPTIVVRTSPNRFSVHVAMGGWASYA